MTQREFAELLRSEVTGNLIRMVNDHSLSNKPGLFLEVFDIAAAGLPDLDDPEVIPKLKAILGTLDRAFPQDSRPRPSMN